MDQDQDQKVFLKDPFDFVDEELCSKILHELFSKKNEKTLDWSFIKLASCDDQVFKVQNMYWKIVCPKLVVPPDVVEKQEENQVLFIKVHSCTGDVLDQIVRYIYTGEMSTRISMKSLSMISTTAGLLGLKFLSVKCNEFLKNNITSSNWNEMLKISIESNDTQIVDKVLSFMKRNIPKFYETEQFFQLSFDEVKRILSWPRGLFEQNKKAMEVFIRWSSFSGIILSVEKFKELYELADKYNFGKNEPSDQRPEIEVITNSTTQSTNTNTANYANTNTASITDTNTNTASITDTNTNTNTASITDTNTNTASIKTDTNTNTASITDTNSKPTNTTTNSTNTTINTSKPTTKCGPGRPRKSLKREREYFSDDDAADYEDDDDDDEKENEMNGSTVVKVRNDKPNKIKNGKRPKKDIETLSSSQIIFYRKDMMKKLEIISYDIDKKSCRTYQYPNELKIYTMLGSTLITGNDRVYKIGGFLSKNKGKISKIIQSFSIPQFLKPENDMRFSWRTDGELSCERTNFSAIIVDKSLYIIGGRIKNRASNEIEKFDLKSNKIVLNDPTTLNPDEIDEDDEKYIMKYFRENFALAHLDNKIYIVGGRGGIVMDNEDDEKYLKTSILESAETFDIESELVEVLPNMNTKRVDHMVVSAYGKIYVLGGRSSNSLTSSAISSVEIFDPKHPTLWTIGRPMNAKRAGGSAFFCDGFIWVVGGNEKTQSIEKFYPNEGCDNLGKWESVCNLQEYNNQDFDLSNCALIVKSI